MTRITELTPLLKRLQLGPIAATLPERIALARREQLDYASFLEIILSDEVNRRAHRASKCGSMAPVSRKPAATSWRRRSPWTVLLDAVFSLEFRQARTRPSGRPGRRRQELPRSGIGAVRAGHTVRFVHVDDFFKAMAQSRVDNSVDRTFRSFLTPDLLILDDLGLHRLTAQQSAGTYPQSAPVFRFIITSNRAVDEWLSLFDDPILGNSALDRLANASYQIVMLS